MHPVNDFDALLLLAVALASKRRAAQLIDVVAAAELISGSSPAVTKIRDSAARLSAHGFLAAQDDGLCLTAAGQAISAAEPKKAETAERIFWVRDQLIQSPTRGEAPSVDLDEAKNAEAVQAHLAAAKEITRNVLVPKPKPAETAKRPGLRQRKPLPAKRRKF